MTSTDKLPPVPVSVEVGGVVDGVATTIGGPGKLTRLPSAPGSAPRWRLELSLRTDPGPLGWDSAIVVDGLLDPLLHGLPWILPAGTEELTGVAVHALDSEDALPLPFGGALFIEDEDHRDLGHAEWRGVLEAHPAHVGLRAQIHRLRSSLAIGERVMEIAPEAAGALPFGPEGLAISSTWSIRTSRGQTQFVFASSRISGPPFAPTLAAAESKPEVVTQAVQIRRESGLLRIALDLTQRI